MWLLTNGAAGRVRARISELKMKLDGADRERDALDRARQLDAEEVGRRADRRQAEREKSERLAETSGETKQDTL